MTHQKDSRAPRAVPADGHGLSPEDVRRRARVDELCDEARAIRDWDTRRVCELAGESLALARQEGSDGEEYAAGVARSLSLLALANAAMGDPEVALSQAAQAMALLDTTRPSELRGDVYQAIGWARCVQGDLAEAVEALGQCLETARATGDRSVEAFALDSMACVSMTAGRYDEALEGHFAALAIQQELGDGISIAQIHNNAAYSYIGLGRVDEALESALAALVYLKEHQLHECMVPVLDTAACVYLRSGELETAESYAHRSIELAKSLDLWRGVQEGLVTLARIQLEQGRHADALETAGRALALAVEHRRYVDEFRCHELLSQIHERRGDQAAALAAFRRFHDLERAHMDRDSAAHIAQIGADHKLETARMDAEIHRLRTLALEREIEERRLAQAHLEAQASLDPLTGLFNRRHLEVITDELRTALERREPVGLMIFDVDGFKSVNDTLGHVAGDRVLVAIADLLVRNCRTSDVPCRYGGDEFLVLLAGMDARGAAEAAERLRTAVEGLSINVGAERVSVTISVGVTSFDPDLDRNDCPDLTTLIERSDRALYEAKRAGRNRSALA